MSFLRKFDAFLNKAEGVLLVLFLSAMILMAFLQVVLRNGFNSTIIWVDILLRHLVLWIGFLGAALATSNDRHISIDAFTRFIRPKARLLVGVFTHLFAVVTCYFLFRASVVFVQNELSVNATLYHDIPAWYSEIIIPSGFALLMIHFLVRALLNVRSFMEKESAS
ncbi:MAG: TRAP transporter small permease [Ignavibacteriales bacterium]|nr:TRAP transporter small permease [Ignavibacteriales bacterium]